MKSVQLLYVENVISVDPDRGDEQRLLFCCAVKNHAYEKVVEIHWAGEDGRWRVLPAAYSRTASDFELWRAEAMFRAAPAADELPGVIEFAVCYRTSDGEWWDNHQGRNHHLRPGHVTAPGVEFMVMDPERDIPAHQLEHLVRMVVRNSLAARSVHVRWTADDWRTASTTVCFPEPALPTAAPHAATVWRAELPIATARRLEYAVACETAAGGTLWDNNFGRNYIARRDTLKVLTLNLHCYEEQDWDAKFWQIARAIEDHRVDIVCLQEVAEPWNDGRGDFAANAARILRDRLHTSYHLATDWSHLGFGRYREGSAILSRYDLVVKDSAFVSPTTDPYSIHSRKIVMAQVEVPIIGPVNVFCAHLSWWSDGFKPQFEALRRWADEKHTPGIAATLLCGDFNSEPASEGYLLATAGGEYEDQYLKAHQRTGRTATTNGADRRIDYIFLKKGSGLSAVTSKVLFTTEDYGPVSDHPGYYAEFELHGSG